MAEFAQRSIEEMLVELEKMRKIGIFSTDEVRAIMKKRKRFEYKLQRRTKEKENFLQYINYEIGLLKLIKLRREKNGIELGKEEIEKEIYLRICKLFRIACFRFKSDTKLWLTHIEFLKKYKTNFKNDKLRASKIFTTMLKIHNKKPNLWIMAAKFEFETNESIETARSLFQRALRFLPHSNKIWLEYFKMELLCVELIIKRRELLKMNEMEEDEDNASDEENKSKQQEDAILSCKIVEIVFKNALKEFKDDENLPHLINSFITIANEFQFAHDLVDRIYKMIEDDENLNKLEESWDVLARRCVLEEKKILEQCAKTGQVADFTIAGLEEKANEFYLKAIDSRLNTLKMHHLYANFLIERLRMDSAFLKEERFERLESAFKRMESQFGDLPLNYLLDWINFKIQFKKRKEAKDLFEKYLKTYKTSKELWYSCLKMRLDESSSKDEADVLDLFKKTLLAVKENETLDLWMLILNWFESNNCKNTEKLFQSATQIMTKKIAEFVRTEYLAWSTKIGIEKTRSIYEQLREIPPYCLEFFQKYIDIERSQTKSDHKRISRGFDDALTHYGKESLDLWLQYISYNYSLDTIRTDVVTSLYSKAIKELDRDLVEKFMQKFCLLKIAINSEPTTSSNKSFSIKK